jgi:thiol-disulfide isomerase/thioredoxin
MKNLYYFLALFAMNSIFAQVNVKNLQGKTVDLFDELDKIPSDEPILVFTWANEYCPPCEKVLSAIQKDFSKLKKDFGLHVVAINIDDEVEFPKHYANEHQSSMGSYINLPSFVKKYTDRKGWAFDHYVDDQAEFYNISQADGAPTAFIFFEEKIYFRQDGFTIPEHKKGANLNDPEIIQATVDTYIDVVRSFSAYESYFSADWLYSTKEDAVFRRSIVKIGSHYEITDSWVTGEIQMRGMSLDVKGIRKFGTFKYYFQNGNLQAEINYANGNKHGVEKQYNEKGILTKLITWVNDVREGPHKDIDEEGGSFEGFYKNNEYDGTWKGFYPNGKPKSENIWENGRLKEIKFYNDPNGNPLDKGTLTNGNGTRKVYNNQGKLIRIDTFEAGKFISEYIVK